MRVSAGGNLVVETARRGVRVMRFARPNLRGCLDDGADSATSPLFREIQDAVLSDLPKGWTLVVNLGLIDAVTAAFYRCLLDVRKCVQARGARLVLCGLSPWNQEIVDLFRGPRLFTIVRTEAEAGRVARGGLSDQEALRKRSLSLQEDRSQDNSAIRPCVVLEPFAKCGLQDAAAVVLTGAVKREDAPA
jgi:anti-anti-sigma regulatory factor